MRIFKRNSILTICLILGFCLGLLCNKTEIENMPSTYIDYNLPQTNALNGKYCTKDNEFIYIWTRLNFKYFYCSEKY